MNVFSNPEFDQHEQVVFAADRNTGLRAIIAIHNTNPGPALGGCRMWPYATEEEAITDVLRLSRGMTYKSAMAGLPLGGGKAVVIGDPRKHKTPALLQALGTAVERLGGRYITIVAGAANNQLADASCGQALRDKGILYAPDYVINAGGVIKICR
jgi:leucine dehydrogenase